MTEAPTITCPECDTPNRVEKPFCENCGYRLRRPGTYREGHPAITPEALEKHQSSARVAKPNKPETQPERQPAVSQRNATVREGDAAEVRRRLAEMAEMPESESDDSDTVLEGLGSVSSLDSDVTEASSEEELSTITRSPPLSSPRESGIFTLQREERTMSWAVLVTAWIVSTGALMLLTYYLTGNAEDNAVELRADSQKVEIEKGEFYRGLDDQTRAFIIMTCQKIADDSEECEQEQLLAGEYPQEEVVLDAYEIDNFEVTNGAWKRCVARGVCPEVNYRDCKVYTHQGLQISLRVPKSVRESQMPVACVTRDEAQKFCEWSQGSLPTHDQWERAARGTEGRLFPWGDAWISDNANWGEVDVIRNPILGKVDGYEWSAPPGNYHDGKSPVQAYDMAGNVAEWVAGEGEGGFARGGSWADNPFDLRTTGRLKLDPDTRRADVGFRCAY